MDYPHTITLSRPDDTPGATGAGVQNRRTGAWTAGPDRSGAGAGADLVWEGPCDYQDARGRSLERNAAGVPTVRSDGTCYLAEWAPMADIRDGDVVRIRFEDGTTADGRVARITRLDHSLELIRV